MSKGFTSPEQSVLLDYLSPWSVVAPGKAREAKHYAVAIGISGTLLTQLLVLISTGLFVSQDEVFPRSSNSPTKVSSLPENFNPFQVDIRPQINLNGFNGSTQYPVGSTEQLTFQPFYLPLNTSLAQPQYSAIVDIFSSDINCQASIRSSFENGYGSASVLGCEITRLSQEQQVTNGQDILMQNGTCTAPGVVSDGDSENKQPLVICAMDAKMKEHTDGKLHGNFGSAGAGPLAAIMADPITCLICRPQYSIKADNVTMTGRTVTDVNILPSASTRRITGLSPWQMAMSSFHALGFIDTPNYLGYVDSYSLVWGNAPFENLLRDINPAVTDFATFYDANALTTASDKTFRRLTAQVALRNDTTIQTCVMRKHGIPPENLFTFRGFSVIIDMGPQLASLLRDTSHFSTKLLTQKLARNYCRLAGARDQVKDSFAIDTHHIRAPKPPSKDQSDVSDVRRKNQNNPAKESQEG
ncbi:MAG: hypothetical protein Q9215_007792 [Flavoplaca cf. flavocitrina]